MPYIPKDDRLKLDAFIEGLSRNVDSPGELNYAITRLCLDYVDKRGKAYQHYSDVYGALDIVKHELFRTECGKYEDVKRILNHPLPRPFSHDARRCPCGGGVDRCESGVCIGSEGTTDGGW